MFGLILPRRLPRRGFPTLLVGLVMAALIPWVAISLLATYHMVGRQRGVEEMRLRDTTQALSLAVVREFAGDIAALNALAVSPALDPNSAEPDMPMLYGHARRLAAQLGASVFALEPDGRHLLTTQRPLGEALPPTASHKLLETVIATGQPAIGDLVKGSVSGRLTFAAEVPVHDATGHVVHVIGASFGVDRLRGLLSAQTLPQDAFAGLSDSHGMVIARTDALHSQMVGQPLPNEIATHVAEADAGMFRAMGADDVERVYAFRRIPNSPGWTIMIGQSAATLDAAWRRPLLALAAGSALALCVATGLALLMARMILLPVRRLRDYASAVAAARGDAPIDGAMAASELPTNSVTELEALRRGFVAAETALRRRVEAEQEANATLVAQQMAQQEQGELLRLFVNWTPAAIAMFDSDLRYLAVSKRFLADYKLEGLTPQSLLGRSHYDVFPEIPESWRAVYRRVLAGETLSSIEDRFVRADGHQDWVRWEMTPWFHSDGTIGGAILLSELTTSHKETEAALRESQARLNAIGEATPDLIFAKDRQGRIVYANPATLAVFGKSAAEVLGKCISAFRDNSPELENSQRINERIMATGQPETIEEPICSADGKSRIFLSTKAPLRDPATGEIVGIMGISHDITEKAMAETMQVRLASIVASIPDAVISFAAEDGQITSWNRGAETLFGWTKAEALGAPGSLLVPDTMPEGGALGVFNWVMQGLTVRDHETVRRTKSGEVIPISVTASQLVAPDGRIIGISGIFRDLRPRYAAEATLRESEARWRTLAEALPQPVWRCQADGSCDYLSHQWEIVTGVAVERHLGFGWLDAVHPDDRERLKADWTTSLVTRNALHAEVRLRAADGSWRWFLKHAVPVLGSDGAVLQWFGTSTDISDMVAARESLTHAAGELERQVEARTAELRESEARLAHAAKMEALGRLAGGVAHDINNVLQVVQGGVAMATARLHTHPERVTRYLDMVMDATERGAAVTGRLLAFARRSELSAAPVEVLPLLNGLAQMLHYSLGPSVTLRVEVDRDVPTVLADSGQLETVLVNLANNARDALPAHGGTITLKAAAGEAAGRLPDELAPGRYVRLSVTDDGVGMPPDLLARVSEPFFTTKPKGQGTGLGLAMARGFAEQSGGTMTIESTSGEGTTVSIWLPVASSSGPRTGTVSPAERDPVPLGRKVLLVDDEQSVREVLAALLDHQGHSVTEADGADAALALLEAGQPVDVLVTDLSMPGALDGAGLVREARLRRPGLPAVLITGHVGGARDGALERMVDTGPFAVLTKPVSAKALEARVAALLDA